MFFTRIRAEGDTILIIEQNVKRTLAIADRAYVLVTGKIAMEGFGASLLKDEYVKIAYPGYRNERRAPYSLQKIASFIGETG